MAEPFERARELLGTSFRPQGRARESGLDCVGLVLLAFDLEHLDLPPYRLSGGSWDQIEEVLAGLFRRVDAAQLKSGDLLVCQYPSSFHLAVIGPESIVHADLRIGRVVETPGQSLGPSGRIYRKNEN